MKKKKTKKKDGITTMLLYLKDDTFKKLTILAKERDESRTKTVNRILDEFVNYEPEKK